VFTIRFDRWSEERGWSLIGRIEMGDDWEVRRTEPPDLDRALIGDAVVTLFRERVAFGRALVGRVLYRWRED
jgi:hypothetical protein